MRKCSVFFIGYFCGTDELPAPTRKCDPGSYCRLGAKVAAPRDNNITGHICPAGRYCLEGTSVPDLCPPGTFSSSEGNEKVGDCTQCTEGMFCQDAGLETPNGNCSEGYYCPSGQNTSKPEQYK